MHIAIGSDHKGLKLKKYVIDILDRAGYSCKDYGCYDETSTDYPDIAKETAEAVAGGSFERGILICSTGIGMSIAANKVKGIRAALCCNAFSAARARMHNDANVLCLGADMFDEYDECREIVTSFMGTGFEGGRHKRRVDKIMMMDR